MLMKEEMQTRTELLERYWVSYIEVRIVTNVIVNFISSVNEWNKVTGYTLMHVAEVIM